MRTSRRLTINPACSSTQTCGMLYLPNYQEIVKRQFAGYIESQLFNAAQIGFLRAVQSVFLQKRHLGRADLYDSPLTSFGEDAVERFFSEEQIEDVIRFADKLAIG